MGESTWKNEMFTARFGEMMVFETLRMNHPGHKIERVVNVDEQKKERDLRETWTDAEGEHVIFHEVKCEPATLGSSIYHTASGIYPLIAQYMRAWEANPYNTGTGNSFIEWCADIPWKGQGADYVWYDEKTEHGGWNTNPPAKHLPHPDEFNAYGFTADGWYSIVKEQVMRGGDRPKRFMWFVYPLVEDVEERAQTMEGRAILADSIMLQCPDTYLVKRVESLLTGKTWYNLREYRAKAIPRTLESGDVKFSYGYCIPAFTREWNGNIHYGLYEVPAQPQNMRFEASSVWDGAKGAEFTNVVTLGRGAGATSECVLWKLNTFIKPVSEWFK